MKTSRLPATLILSAWAATLVPAPAADPAAPAPGTKLSKEDQILQKLDSMQSEINRLKKNVEKIAPAIDKEKRIAEQQAKARARMRQDAEVYNLQQRQQIEQLYQTANQRDSDPKLVIENLRQVMADFPESNRAGCACLYLAQRTEGDEQLDYLKQAETTYADCFYGDGVQVGAYALWYQAMRFRDEGDKPQAEAMLTTLQEKYPNAIDHHGNALADLIPRFFQHE